MKSYQLRQLTYNEAVNRASDAEEELSNLRFQLATRKELGNHRRIRQMKREIAQLKTILHEHQLGLRKLALGPQPQEPEENSSETTGKKEDQNRQGNQ
ncbi:MAG: 50S ribosomal protein L29 [Candidatus Latescibacteria bacterium]|nr:50S ribosomal protein L29 [Candidatus Latescibacterota bacterium]